MSARSGTEERRKTKIIMVRVAPDEFDALQERSQDTGTSVPEHLRTCGMGRRTHSVVDSIIINEMRRFGGLQTHLFNEGRGAQPKEFAAVLVELKNAIARIGQ
ncbi:TPA: mobilization protein [Burkholderia aenigmatica]|uniref:plasmid mobilization protein MobA n=1 Tax=Burkholderia sp. AU45251 TaxID=3059204 RepID=UPI00264A9894|nr:plasmid mobilization protein MobA [Burkholderia sp. AU45251]HDR9482854.1 mobilization protein [Burkholderia aenigmatica]MDN7519462.1 plasmid mobilization protein MobA [Burkholderia sp. AU45251]HDR9513801.1 mobilization protein [Burkholderia aenigmatica]HDR9591192.1 mobilization protein [Burkholderia aenigmatica]HDR9599174.1 mobilization protein [Burkholderia aenigmatica]